MTIVECCLLNLKAICERSSSLDLNFEGEREKKEWVTTKVKDKLIKLSEINQIQSEFNGQNLIWLQIKMQIRKVETIICSKESLRIPTSQSKGSTPVLQFHHMPLK